VKRLFERTGMSWDDIDLVELNEAFAPQVLAVLKGWGWDERDRLNVNGSGISLGHPIGATGGPYPGQPAARAAAPRRQVRPGDHVHRRRPGHRGGVRAGLARGFGRASIMSVMTTAWR
jgi:acetyl-CoA acetyltransferase